MSANLPPRPLRLLLTILCLFVFSACDPVCDWTLSIETWHDLNGNGVREAGEAPLENVAVTVTRQQRLHHFVGSDSEGKGGYFVGWGHCQSNLGVSARAPDGYTPTTPDRVRGIDQKYQQETAISFGFAYQAGATPTPRPTGLVNCQSMPDMGGDLYDVEAGTSRTLWALAGSPEPELLRIDDVLETNPVVTHYSRPLKLLVDIALDHDGTLWAIERNRKRIAKFDGSEWSTTLLPEGITAGEVIVATPNGHLWMATDKGVLELDPVASLWTEHHVEGFNSATALVATEDGTVLVVTDNTVAAIDSNSPQQRAHTSLIEPPATIDATHGRAALAPDGSLWVLGTAEGHWDWGIPMLANYEPSSQEWTHFTHESTGGAMPIDDMKGVAVLSDGSVLVNASRLGFFRLIPGDDGTPRSAIWITYPRLVQEFEIPYNNHFLATTPGDLIWIGDLVCRIPMESGRR